MDLVGNRGYTNLTYRKGKKGLAGTRMSMEQFLKFIFEFKDFVKEAYFRRTIQAMSKNRRIQISSNDTVRRLFTTIEAIGAGYKRAVIDQFKFKPVSTVSTGRPANNSKPTGHLICLPKT